jgi:hypothetical protein
MGALRIPDRYKEGLGILVSLPNGSSSELLDVLTRAPQTANFKELASWVTPEVKSLTASQVSSVIGTLTSLARVLARINVSAERLASDLYDAVLEDGGKAADPKGFQELVAKLLVLPALNVLGEKARELQGEFERTFCEARILTDLRPVFGDDPQAAPSTMVIVHTLKIGYHDAHTATHKEIFVALDTDDIATLKKNLERAELKARSLKARLEGTGIKSTDLS